MPKPKQWSPRGEDTEVNIYSYSDEDTLYGQAVRDNDGGWNVFVYGGVVQGPTRVGHFTDLAQAKQAVEDYFTEIK